MVRTRKVFVAWDGTTPHLKDALWALRENPDEGRDEGDPRLEVVVPMLGDDASGEIWRDVVAERIESSDVVLAFLDRPNANVGYEVGFALGRARDVHLAYHGEELPSWTRREPFKTQALQRLPNAAAMRRLLRGRGAKPLPRPEPPSRGSRTALLCPSDEYAEDVRGLLGQLEPRVPAPYRTEGRGFVDLAQDLDGVDRALWLLLSYPEGAVQRDGQENAALAAVAGFLQGCGCEVVALRHAQAREVVDVDLTAREWELPRLESLLSELCPIEARPEVTASQALEAWRAHLADWNSQLVPFFGAEGSQALGTIWVERELAAERDGEVPAWGDAAARDELRRSSLADCIECHRDEHAGAGGLWLVLGSPGAGKTTLLRRLCAELADKLRDDDSGPVPVLLSLAHLAETRRQPLELAEDDLDGDAPGLAAELARLAQQGRVWFLLDGLDEVRPRDLLGLPERLEAIHKVFRLCPIVVTSRDEGRRDLGLPLQPMRLLDLQDPEKLFKAWLPETGADIWRDIARHATLRALARNAWMATLMAKLAGDGGTVPRRRGDLFDQAVDLLLRRGIDQDPDADPTAPPRGVKDPVAARDLLEPLALRLQRDGGESWTERLLNRHVRRCGQDDQHPHYAADLEQVYGSADAFLKDVRQHSGLLCPRRGPREPWEFVHRSLREYLAAAAWIERSVPEGKRPEYLDLVADLRRRLADDETGELQEHVVSQWGETLVLIGSSVEDPAVCRELLDELRQLPGGLLLRTLPSVKALGRAEALDVLLSAEDWSGDDLLLLVQGWLEQGDAAQSAGELLLSRLKPQTGVEEAGRLLYAVEEAGLPVDPSAFFGAWGRDTFASPSEAGIRMVSMPAGSFVMGAEGEWAAEPEHQVALQAFELARCPVTRGEAARLLGLPEESGDDASRPAFASFYATRLLCRLMGARLPSEAEWEYACRAGTTSLYSCGDDESGLARHAWFGGDWFDGPHPVGAKLPNPWGLQDMHGNVWEWCEDTWHETYEGAPRDGSAWVDTGSVVRVIRGDCWLSTARGCRSASRGGDRPGTRIPVLGFRPARSLH